MSDVNGTTTTTTMWQDKHSDLRRHELMTKELGETIPALYANEKVENTDAVLARVKLFTPFSNWTWYITEWTPRPASASASSRASRMEWATSASTSSRR